MPPVTSLAPAFVEYVPEQLEDGRLYIAIGLRTMVHRCACGCAREVVTPIGPLGWRFTYDGASVWVQPSIGNWSLPCRSHYWIEENGIRWARSWSRAEVESGRAHDRALRAAARLGRSPVATAPVSGWPQSLLRRFAGGLRWAAGKIARRRYASSSEPSHTTRSVRDMIEPRPHRED